MPYIIHRDADDTDDWTEWRETSKDDLIALLVWFLRSSHGERIRIIYPDGSEWA